MAFINNNTIQKEEKKEIKKLNVMSAEELLDSDIPPIKVLVKSLFAEGLVVLSAPPKTGKSMFLMQLGIALSNGIDFLGLKTAQQVGVLYFDFENSDAIRQSRLEEQEKYYSDNDNNINNRNLYFISRSEDIGRLKDGFEEQLICILDEKPNISLVIIDVEENILPPRKSKEDKSYIYNAYDGLKEICNKRHICIILVTHDRKQKDERDFTNNVSGTTGRIGCADTTIAIEKESRSSEYAVLRLTSRVIEDTEIPIRFNSKYMIWEASTEEVEKPEHDNLLNAICKAVSCVDKFDGRPNSLIDACKEIDNTIDISNVTFGKEWNTKIAPYLALYDLQGERYKYCGNMYYRLSLVNTDDYEWGYGDESYELADETTFDNEYDDYYNAVTEIINIKSEDVSIKNDNDKSSSEILYFKDDSERNAFIASKSMTMYKNTSEGIICFEKVHAEGNNYRKWYKMIIENIDETTEGLETISVSDDDNDTEKLVNISQFIDDSKPFSYLS